MSISQTGVVPEHPSCVVPDIRQRLHSLLERQMRFEGGLATKLLLELGQSEVDAEMLEIITVIIWGVYLKVKLYIK